MSQKKLWCPRVQPIDGLLSNALDMPPTMIPFKASPLSLPLPQRRSTSNKKQSNIAGWDTELLTLRQIEFSISIHQNKLQKPVDTSGNYNAPNSIPKYYLRAPSSSRITVSISAKNCPPQNHSPPSTQRLIMTLENQKD